MHRACKRRVGTKGFVAECYRVVSHSVRQRQYFSWEFSVPSQREESSYYTKPSEHPNIDMALVHKHLFRAYRAIDRLKPSMERSCDDLPSSAMSRPAPSEIPGHFTPVFLPAHVITMTSNSIIDGVMDPPDSPREDASFNRRINGLSAFASLYGGAHLSAWSAHFPTVTEMWFWRVISLLLTVAAPAFVLGPMLPVPAHVFRGAQFGRKRWLLVRYVYSFCVDLLALTGAAGVGFGACGRIFFLIEAFISLRSPPEGTYRTVSWTKFIPHAS